MFLQRLSALVLILVVGISTAWAQMPQQMPQQVPTEVSEDEIEQFAHAFREIQVIDQQVQQEMHDAVHEEGIDVERFNEYLFSQQDPMHELNASEEELEKFASAYEEIEEIQEEALKEIENIISNNNLTIERYQEIAMAIQTNPELLEKLQEYFEE